MPNTIDEQIEALRKRYRLRRKQRADARENAAAQYRAKRKRRLQTRLDASADPEERRRIRAAIRRADEGSTGWVTVHPNGGKGQPVLLENGVVVGGAGGSLNGRTLSRAKSRNYGKKKTSEESGSAASTEETASSGEASSSGGTSSSSETSSSGSSASSGGTASSGTGSSGGSVSSGVAVSESTGNAAESLVEETESTGTSPSAADLNKKIQVAQAHDFLSAMKATREGLRDCAVGTEVQYVQRGKDGAWSVYNAVKVGENQFEITSIDGEATSGKLAASSDINTTAVGTVYFGGAEDLPAASAGSGVYTETMPSSSGTGEWSSAKEYREAKARAAQDYEAAVAEENNLYVQEKERLDAEYDQAISEFYQSARETQREMLAQGATQREVSEHLQELAGNTTAQASADYVTAKDAHDARLAELENAYLSVFDADYRYKEIEGEHSIQEDADAGTINPKGLYNNCQRCAISYELRRRGYDAKASGGEAGQLAQIENIQKCFQDTEQTYLTDDGSGSIGESGVETLKSLMEGYGEGARAVACVSWAGTDYGHAFNLEVDSSGDVWVADAQTGFTGRIGKDEAADQYVSRIADAVVIRTDTATLTSKVEKYAARNVKSRTKS